MSQEELQKCSWTEDGEHCNEPAEIECTVGSCAPARKWCMEHYEQAHLPENERRKRGAPEGNDHAMHGEYHRMMVSMSGPNYDVIRRRLEERGIHNPSGKEVVQEMNEARLDWGQFGFEYKEAEKSALGVIRADYQWIKECEVMSIETLREIIASGPYVPREDGRQPRPEEVNEPFRALHMKRHRQAQIVLEARETGYDPLAPRIC